MKRREPLKEWNEWLRSFCFAGWFACFGLSFSSRSAMAQCAHNPPQESKTKPTFTNRPHSLALPSRLDRPPPFNKNQRFLINGRAPSAPQSKTIQSIHSQRIDWNCFCWCGCAARYIGPSSSRLTNQQSIDFTNSIHKFIPLFNQIDCCLRYHRGSWCQYNNYCYNIFSFNSAKQSKLYFTSIHEKKSYFSLSELEVEWSEARAAARSIK